MVTANLSSTSHFRSMDESRCTALKKPANGGLMAARWDMDGTYDWGGHGSFPLSPLRLKSDRS